MPTVRCAHCAAQFTVPETAVGKTARCAKCRQAFVVRPAGPPPLPEATAEPDEEAPQPSARPRVERDRDERDDDRPRSRKSRRPAGKKRNRKARSRFPKWVLIAGSAGALLVLGGLVWLAIGLVGGGGGGTDQVAAAREPGPGPGSWVPPAPVPAADRANWKMTADPAAPLATGLRSTFALTPPDKLGPLAVLFPAPGTATAAALVPAADRGAGADWVRLDLKTGATARVATVPVTYTANGVRSFQAVLSPSGERLAAGVQNSPGDLVLWSAGGELPRIKAPVTSGGDLDWLGFAGDDRLVTMAAGKATGWDVATGQPAYTLAAEFKGPLAVSPGGKWVGGFTGPRGFEWFAAADGRPAGLLPLPDGWFDKTRPVGGLAFRPDGKAVAGFAHNIMGDLLIAVWDPADGRPLESVVVPQPHLQERLDPPTATWAGDRRLVFASGFVVDLDLHTVLCRYQFQTAALVAGPSPDGRYWRVVADGDASGPTKAGKFGGGYHLVAATVPHAGVTDTLEVARQGFLWHPGVAVRAEVDAAVPKEQRGPLLDALAEGLAAKGYRVDPQARVRVKVNVKTETGKVLGEHVKQVGPNLAEYKVARGFIGELSYEVTDAATGRKLMATPDPGKVYAADTGGSGREDVWRALREYARGLQFPRLFLRDAGGAFLRPTPVFLQGIDGVVEATARDVPVVGLDGFKLPSDPPK